MEQVIIDVREKDEFLTEYVDGSINIPLSAFSISAPSVLNRLEKSNVLIMCHSGVRAGQALKMIKESGFSDMHRFEVYDGGILRWKRHGQPVVSKNGKAPLPLIRQVHLLIGCMAVSFGVAAVLVDPMFALGSVFIGCGLLVAGATGFCLLANVLAMMPWNRSSAAIKVVDEL